MVSLYHACSPLPTRLRLFCCSASLLLIVLLAVSQAQVRTSITPDGSLGTRVTPQGNVFTISGGTRPGNGPNLFHSFDRFTVGTNDTASFMGAAGIKNILSRVTGGNSSLIDGLLQSQIPGAHLYLLNPSGVMFGPNASLDVGGSFHVSTADYLRLADGAKFHANLSQASVLTVAPPEAFGFLGSTPTAIAIERSGLQVPAGQTLSVVGGDINFLGDPTFNFGFLYAPGGRINLASVAAPGEVQLGDPNLGTDAFARLGNITISQGAAINVDGSNFNINPAGTIVIRGGQLRFSDTFIVARGNPGGLVSIKGDRVMLGTTEVNAGTRGNVNHPGTAVDVHAQGEFVLADGEIAASSFQAGRAGDIRIKAGSIQLGPDDPNVTTFLRNIGSRSFGSGPTGNVEITTPGSLLVKNGFFFGTRALSTGNGGNVTVRAGTLEVRDGGFIDASALIGGAGPPSGNSGNLEVAADTVLLSSKNATQFTGLTTQSQGTGNAGALRVTVGSLQVLDGAEITTALLRGSSGQGAALEVNAKTVVISGTSANGNRANIGGILSGRTATGTGSDVRITAETVQVTNGGFISSSLTNGAPGNAGNITIRTGSLEVTERGFIAASSFSGTGNAGNLEVTAKDVRISGLSTSPAPFSTNDFTGFSTTTNAGRGGDVRITAESLLITNKGSLAAASRGSGNAGTIALQLSGSLRVTDGGTITTSAFGSGHGGAIDVRAASVTIAGAGRFLGPLDTGVSAITSQAGLGGGSAGDVRITAGSLHVLDGAKLTAQTFGPGHGGNIDVQANSVLVSGVNAALRDALTGIGADPRAAGAAIVASSNRFFLGDNATGNAGSVRLAAENVQVRDGGLISSATETPGTGGNIALTTDRVTLSGGAVISAESSVSPRAGKAGDISITARDTFHSDNSKVTTAADQAEGGTITLTAGQVRLGAGAAVSAESAGAGKAGGIRIMATDTFRSANSAVTTAAQQADGGAIQINAQGVIELHDSDITASVEGGVGTGGNVALRAPTLRMDGGTIQALTRGSGRAGEVAVQVGSLTLVGGARIDSSSFSAGRGGTVTVTATDTATIAGQQSGLLASTAGSGQGGDILLQARQVELADGAVITAASTGTGHAGSVTIVAHELLHNAHSTVATDTQGSGEAGRVAITAPALTMVDGRISAVTSGTGKAGRVVVEAQRLALTGNAQIDSSSAGAGQAGGVTVTASEVLSLTGSGGIASNATNQGAAGTVIVTTPSLQMDGPGAIEARTTGDGQAGNVEIRAERLMLMGGARIGSSSGQMAPNGVVQVGRGQGGEVMVTATDELLISGRDQSGAASGIFSQTLGPGNAGRVTVTTPRLTVATGGQVSAATGGDGRGGDVVVQAGAMSLTSGAQITSSSGLMLGATHLVGSGAGGTVTVTASDTVDIAGQESVLAASTAGPGRGGDVLLEARQVQLMENARITAIGSGMGDAGSVTIVARETLRSAQSAVTTTASTGAGGAIILTAGSAIDLSATDIAATVTGGQQPGGSISVTTPRLTMTGGSLAAETQGSGKAGDISLAVDTVMAQEATLTSSSTGMALGNAGTVTVHGLAGPGTPAHQVTLTQSTLRTAAEGTGTGGALTITARDSLRLEQTTLAATVHDGTDLPEGQRGDITLTAPALTLTGGQLTAETTGTRRAGDIALHVGRLTVQDALLTSSSRQGATGNAGTVVIQGLSPASPRAQTVVLTRSGVSTEAAVADGGDIAILAQGTVQLLDSGLTTAVRSGVGQGGNILIDPTFVILERSQILADAFGGPGGNIRVVAQGFVADAASRVSASSAQNVPGTITIEAVTTPSGLVAPLPLNFAAAEALLRNRCVARLREGTVSSLVVRQRESVPTPPDALLPSRLYEPPQQPLSWGGGGFTPGDTRVTPQAIRTGEITRRLQGTHQPGLALTPMVLNLECARR